MRYLLAVTCQLVTCMYDRVLQKYILLVAFMLQLVLILFISCSVRYPIAQQHSALYSGCSIVEKPFMLSTAVDMLCNKKGSRAGGFNSSSCDWCIGKSVVSRNQLC